MGCAPENFVENFDCLLQIYTSGRPFTNMVLTLIPAWLSNHTSSKVWNEITYPFLNCNRCSLGMDKYFNFTYYNGCNYLYILALKLIYVSKSGHRPLSPIYWRQSNVLRNYRDYLIKKILPLTSGIWKFVEQKGSQWNTRIPHGMRSGKVCRIVQIYTSGFYRQYIGGAVCHAKSSRLFDKNLQANI